jgi:hypothetical protein
MNTLSTAAMAVFGWLVPGGAYLFVGRKRQFALSLVLVSAAFLAGIALQGGNQWPRGEDLGGLDSLSILLAHAGSLVKMLAGGPRLLSWIFDYSQGFLAGKLHEYGTMLLVAAGLLNLLAMADAWELRKPEQS